MIIQIPTQNQPLIKGEAVDPNWYVLWSKAAKWINENSQSGTTAQRPTERLYAGRHYFDTSLGAKGKPIWRNKDNDGWVDASGSSV